MDEITNFMLELEKFEINLLVKCKNKDDIILHIIDNFLVNYINNKEYINMITDAMVNTQSLIIKKILINKGAVVNGKNDNDGKTLLMLVKTVEEAKLLIEMGAEIDAQDSKGNTFLYHLIAEYNYDLSRSHDKIACFLIDNGANVNIKNEKGQTLLMGKYDYIKSKLVKKLIKKGLNINELDNDGNNALMYCYNLDTLKLLISYGINIDNKNNEGSTALMNSTSDIKTELLISSGCDVNIEDNNGNTALMLCNNLNQAKLLLKNNSPYDITNDSNIKESKTFKYLRRNFDNCYQRDIEAYDSDDDNLINISDEEIIKLLQDHCNSVMQNPIFK
jgi:ankyrin repeat protein